VSTKIILFSLALDKTYAVFKISFATMLHAIGAHTGSDIFHFVVFCLHISSSWVKLRLHTENRFPMLSGNALKVELGYTVAIWYGIQWQYGGVVVQLITLSTLTTVELDKVKVVVRL
jgi:hypothetical protein